MIKIKDLTKYLNETLNIYDYSDYGPNGLQIQGKEDIKKIAFAVSATRESITKAVEIGADALIVHHGLFWKFHGTRALTGAFYKRVAPLIKNDINLLGYHLPLDGHIELGNAACIAQKLDLEKIKPFGEYKGMPTGVRAQFKQPIDPSKLAQDLEQLLGHKVIHSCPSHEKIRSIGIITGGANSNWTDSLKFGLDAYLTGEISEHDWHEAKESDIHFFAGGHNATEQFGIQAILKDLHEKFQAQDIELFFIPSDNPA